MYPDPSPMPPVKDAYIEFLGEMEAQKRAQEAAAAEIAAANENTHTALEDAPEPHVKICDTVPYKRIPPKVEPPVPPQYRSSDRNTDLLFQAAETLMALAATPDSVDTRTLADIEKALRHHAVRLGERDFGGMEIMLACQTQTLNRMFTESIGKYAKSTTTDEQRLYSVLALKAQDQCRNTVHELKHIMGPKVYKDYDRAF